MRGMVVRVMIFTRNNEIEIRRRDTVLVDAPELARPAGYGNRPERRLDRCKTRTRIDQRTEQHITARAADHFEVDDVHSFSVASRAESYTSRNERANGIDGSQPVTACNFALSP